MNDAARCVAPHCALTEPHCLCVTCMQGTVGGQYVQQATLGGGGAAATALVPQTGARTYSNGPGLLLRSRGLSARRAYITGPKGLKAYGLSLSKGTLQYGLAAGWQCKLQEG